jgi:hypothetical protein
MFEHGDSIQPWIPEWLKAYPKELPVLNPNPARVKTIA